MILIVRMPPGPGRARNQFKRGSAAASLLNADQALPCREIPTAHQPHPSKQTPGRALQGGTQRSE